MGYFAQRIGDLESAGPWQARIDRLREDARRPRAHQLTRPYIDYATLEALRADLDALRALPRDERPHAWPESRVNREGIDPAPNVPARDAERYLSLVETTAGRYLGATAAAPLVHALVREPAGYAPDVPRALDQLAPALHGAQASSVAAYVTGTSWSSPEALRAAYCRHQRPAPEQVFSFFYGDALT